MKNLLYIFLSLTVSPLLKAQSNLVSNPSFEFYTHCPISGGDSISVATPWTGPTINSTDYFNVCSSEVPSIAPGYFQYARTGNAYIAFWGAFNGGPNYREYLQSPLSSSLLLGKCYYIEFYTNVANYTRVGINNIAAHLTDTTFPTNLSFPGEVLNLQPHALKFQNPVIIDTLNWVKVSGIYTAIGGENSIIIGNFKDDAHTNSICLCPSPYSAAYLFIDDVSVIPTDSMSLPPYAGNDTTIAAGDSAFIGRQLYGLNCNWYNNNVLLDTNISGIYVKPTVTTTYVVEQNLCGNIGYDTITVSVVGFADIEKYAAKSNIIAYPNPANNKIFIKQMTNENITIDILNAYSEKIIRCTQTEIDISGLANGIYFIQLTTKENISTQKIIVQH